MKPQPAHTKLFVELSHFLPEILCVHCAAKGCRQMADAVSDAAVKHLPRPASILIIHKDLDTVRAKVFFQSSEIIVKQFFKDREIMEGNLVNAAFCPSDDLAGGAVCILVIHKQERQICMPEVSLKPMAHREFQQPIDTFKEKAS